MYFWDLWIKVIFTHSSKLFPHTQKLHNDIICVGLTVSYLCLHRLVWVLFLRVEQLHCELNLPSVPHKHHLTKWQTDNMCEIIQCEKDLKSKDIYWVQRMKIPFESRIFCCPLLPVIWLSLLPNVKIRRHIYNMCFVEHLLLHFLLE